MALRSPAEGGITRYLAIFHSQALKGGTHTERKAIPGPSGQGWGAIFGQCGGDPKDLEPIREWKVVDADEFARGDPTGGTDRESHLITSVPA